jgi:hypothetical protein
MAKPDNVPVELQLRPGVPEGQIYAEGELQPHIRHAALGAALTGSFFKEQGNVQDRAAALKDTCAQVRDGKLDVAQDILTAQATTLDAMFTEFMRRGLANIGQYPESVDRYMRLAFKAQAQCRATVEAMDRLNRGGEQIIKHIHVDNRGGQAVIADTVHTGGQNGKLDQPPQAQVAHAPFAPMRSQDPSRDGVRLAFDAERAVQDARR